MRVSGALWLLIFLLLAPALVTAQEDGFFEGDMFVFGGDELVVTASKHEQKISEAPAAISIITREDIRLSGAFNVGELFDFIPGVDFIANYGGSIDITARGLNEFETTKTLVLIDGQMVNRAFHRNVVWDVLPIFLEDFERIEIIRGPGSSLYGAYAFSGVINIITRAAADRTSTLSLTGGEKDSIGLIGSFGGSAGDFSGGVTVGYRETDGYGDRSAADDIKDWSEFPQASARARFQFSDKTDLDITASYLTGDKAVPEFSAILRDMPTGADSGYFGARLSTAFSESWQAKAILGGQLSSNDSGVLAHESRQVNLDLQNFINIAEGNLLIFGLYGENSAAVADEPDSFDLDESESIWAAYVQDEWKVTEQVSLTLGGRYDKSDIFADGEFSPRGTIIFSPSKNHNFRVGYGSAFRPPSFVENYANLIIEGRTPLIGIITAGDDPKPEKIQSIEAGYLGSIVPGKVSLNVQIFQNSATNLVRSFFEPGDDTHPDWVRYDNVGEVDSTGAEMEVKFNTEFGVSGFLNFSYQDVTIVRDASGQSVDIQYDLVPEDKGNLGLKYKHQGTGLMVQTIIHYLGETQICGSAPAFPPRYDDAHATVDLALGIDLLDGDLQITLAGKNIFDYDEVGYGELFFNDFPNNELGTERRLMANISYTF